MFIGVHFGNQYRLLLVRTVPRYENIMQYSKTFTVLSMIVFVMFFIGLWFILEKSSNKSNHNS